VEGGVWASRVEVDRKKNGLHDQKWESCRLGEGKVSYMRNVKVKGAVLVGLAGSMSEGGGRVCCLTNLR